MSVNYLSVNASDMAGVCKSFDATLEGLKRTISGCQNLDRRMQLYEKFSHALLLKAAAAMAASVNDWGMPALQTSLLLFYTFMLMDDEQMEREILKVMCQLLPNVDAEMQTKSSEELAELRSRASNTMHQLLALE
jgi:hypothetical protein